LNSWQGQDAFLFFIIFRLALGSTLPPLGLAVRTVFPRVKRQRREADHSPPPNIEVRDRCNCISLHQVSSAYKDNVTFYVYRIVILVAITVDVSSLTDL
jgi:hypothetical protein